MTFDSATYGLRSYSPNSRICISPQSGLTPGRTGLEVGRQRLPWLLDSRFAERRGSNPWLVTVWRYGDCYRWRQRESMLGSVASVLWKNHPDLPPSHWTREPYVHTTAAYAIDADLAKDRSYLQGLILKNAALLRMKHSRLTGRAFHTGGAHQPLNP